LRLARWPLADRSASSAQKLAHQTPSWLDNNRPPAKPDSQASAQTGAQILAKLNLPQFGLPPARTGTTFDRGGRGALTARTRKFGGARGLRVPRRPRGRGAREREIERTARPPAGVGPFFASGRVGGAPPGPGGQRRQDALSGGCKRGHRPAGRTIWGAGARLQRTLRLVEAAGCRAASSPRLLGLLVWAASGSRGVRPQANWWASWVGCWDGAAGLELRFGAQALGPASVCGEKMMSVSVRLHWSGEKRAASGRELTLNWAQRLCLEPDFAQAAGSASAASTSFPSRAALEAAQCSGQGEKLDHWAAGRSGAAAGGGPVPVVQPCGQSLAIDWPRAGHSIAMGCPSACRCSAATADNNRRLLCTVRCALRALCSVRCERTAAHSA